jgi:hypothetical protein
LNSAEVLAPVADELDFAWQAYLTSGGFPGRSSSIIERAQRANLSCGTSSPGCISMSTGNRLSISVPLLMAELHAHSTSPLNRSKAAEYLGYQTRKSFDLRLNRLVRSYGALWAHRIDERGVRSPAPSPSFTSPTHCCPGLVPCYAPVQVSRTGVRLGFSQLVGVRCGYVQHRRARA